MTEEEAKTKWCPFAMAGAWTRCVASQCMAWRGQGSTSYDQGPSQPFTETVANTGYCGLAGKP